MTHRYGYGSRIRIVPAIALAGLMTAAIPALGGGILDDSLARGEQMPLPLLLLLLALATLISEDLTCITAGLLVARGTLGFGSAVGACLAGIFVGDLLLFAAGRFIGSPILRKRPIRWFIKQDAVTRSTQWFDHNGPIVIITSRFVPGTRLPTYVTAGLLRMTWWKFGLYFLAASMIWTPLLVGLAAALGQTMRTVFERYHSLALPMFLLVAFLIWVAVECIIPLFTFRGRRLLLATWKRRIHYEFWPPQVFYIPIVLYILWLGLRYRHPTLFTAANPAMPAGGFVGESKAEILTRLSAVCPELVCRITQLPEHTDYKTRLHTAREFMARHGLTYPVVAKPERGERGRSVQIIRNPSELEKVCREMNESFLVQEFAPGEEFGVFYMRKPSEQSGRIFGITRKSFPTIVGDGHSTVEELILRHKRAVCMAPTFLAAWKEHIFDVLPAGEERKLVEVGNHCRGAVFLDGGDLASDALLNVLDRVADGCPGYQFGRFDIIVPRAEDLKTAENLKIIELNGVTSEATNIYDPGYSIWKAYGVLFRQWKWAFEIGAEEQARGHRPASVSALWHVIRTHQLEPRREGTR